MLGCCIACDLRPRALRLSGPWGGLLGAQHMPICNALLSDVAAVRI